MKFLFLLLTLLPLTISAFFGQPQQQQPDQQAKIVSTASSSSSSSSRSSSSNKTMTTTMDWWDDLLEKYRIDPWDADPIFFEMALEKLTNASDDSVDWIWLEESLQSFDKMWIVAAVLQRLTLNNKQFPERLFVPVLETAISVNNPSANQVFVKPCIKAFGHRRVNEYLLDIVEGRGDDNSNERIAGAVSALYWANILLTFKGGVGTYNIENATPESRAAYLELKDVWQRKRETYLKVFVHNTNLNVRREVIPSLKLDDESVFPEELKPLVRQAIEIARNHSDEYIRHRVEVQLGNEGILQSIPPRGK